MHNNDQEIENAQTWRELLGKAASRPGERQRIAAALRINTITITRWVTGPSKPRVEALRALPQVLPQYAEKIITLLKIEYPDLFIDAPIVDLELSIPSVFYRQVLNTYAMDAEQLRISNLRDAILRQIIHQFDPDREGFAVFIAQCVPPGPDHKVRSLRIALGDGGPSAIHFKNQTYFCGAESQAGLAVLSVHPITFQSPEEMQRVIPGRQTRISNSSLAMPLLQYDRVAGSACFASPQRDFFSPDRVNLLKQYVDLLTMIFETHEFYPLSTIHLTMLPVRPQQKALLSTLQQRITARMLDSLSEGLPLSRPQAEEQIIKEIEGELIQLALTTEQNAEVHVGL